MAMALTRGDDSRLDGAPRQELPSYADMVEKVSVWLVSQSPELYDNDPANARSDAVAYIKQQESLKQEQAAKQRAAGQRGIAERAAARQARAGVDPEALPYATSGRDIQEANRPLDEAEAALDMEERAASDIIRGSREGQRNWGAESDLQYLRERGEKNPLAPEGQRDLDVRRRWMEGRGQFYEMPDGTRIPVGRDPTAAELRNIREFDEWANETPGTERQALYDPEGYEQFREGARQDIQDRARASGAYYGTGNDAQLMDAAESGNRTAQDQLGRRMARSASEDRQAEAEREVRIARLARAAGVSREQARKMMDSGRAAARPAVAGKPANPLPLTVEERRLESQSLRDMAGTRRDAELAARQQSLRDQRMLLAPGGRGVVNAINQLPDGWREIALLDRLTNGRVGGPTPLGVAQHQAQAAAEMASRAFTGALANMDPAARAQQQLANDLALAGAPPETKVQLSRQRGEPMGTGYSAAHVGARWNHWTYNFGPRPDSWRLGNFRAEMEGLGYQPAEIDAFIDARMNDPDAGPPAAATPPAGIPSRASAPPATRGPR